MKRCFVTGFQHDVLKNMTSDSGCSDEEPLLVVSSLDAEFDGVYVYQEGMSSMGLCYTNERGKFLYLAPHHGAWTILETAIENNHAGTQLLRKQSVWLQILGSDNWRETYPLAVMHDSRCLLVSKAEGGSASTEMYPFSEVLPASPLGAYFLLFAGPLLVPCKNIDTFPRCVYNFPSPVHCSGGRHQQG